MPDPYRIVVVWKSACQFCGPPSPPSTLQRRYCGRVSGQFTNPVIYGGKSGPVQIIQPPDKKAYREYNGQEQKEETDSNETRSRIRARCYVPINFFESALHLLSLHLYNHPLGKDRHEFTHLYEIYSIFFSLSNLCPTYEFSKLERNLPGGREEKLRTVDG